MASDANLYLLGSIAVLYRGAPPILGIKTSLPVNRSTTLLVKTVLYSWAPEQISLMMPSGISVLGLGLLMESVHYKVGLGKHGCLLSREYLTQ